MNDIDFKAIIRLLGMTSGHEVKDNKLLLPLHSVIELKRLSKVISLINKGCFTCFFDIEKDNNNLDRICMTFYKTK